MFLLYKLLNLTTDACFLDRMVARYRKTEALWTVMSVTLDHNRSPSSEHVSSYRKRRQDLTLEMTSFMGKLLASNVAPSDVHRVYRVTYLDGLIVTMQDLANIQKVVGCRGGSEGARNLLNLLHDEAEKDPRWFIKSLALLAATFYYVLLLFVGARSRQLFTYNYCCRFKHCPTTNQLTHLFWMSPNQRDMAKDCYQILIHDNTYKTNRFKPPLGIFFGVNKWVLLLAGNINNSAQYNITIVQD